MIKIKYIINKIKKNIQGNSEYYYMPRFLFKKNKYSEMTAEAKILYTILLYIQAENENSEYIHFTREKACEYLRCKGSKAKISFLELEKNNLIREVRQGSCKPNKIYLNDIVDLEVENE